jgi:hypothetical protein
VSNLLWQTKKVNFHLILPVSACILNRPVKLHCTLLWWVLNLHERQTGRQNQKRQTNTKKDRKRHRLTETSSLGIFKGQISLSGALNNQTSLSGALKGQTSSSGALKGQTSLAGALKGKTTRQMPLVGHPTNAHVDFVARLISRRFLKRNLAWKYKQLV